LEGTINLEIKAYNGAKATEATIIYFERGNCSCSNSKDYVEELRITLLINRGKNQNYA